MKHFYSLLFSFTLVTLFVCFSCTEDYVSDPLDPRLVMYTEDGSDVAGAMFNDQLWTSVLNVEFLFGGYIDEPKIRSYPNHDSIVLVFEGQMENAPSENYDIEFHLGDVSIDQISDMTSLNQRHILIDGLHNSCHVTGYTSGVPASQVTGHLYFRKVTPETMSGTFYVKIGEVMEISYGRFDYRLSVIDLDLR